MSCYHPILGIPRYDDSSDKTFRLAGSYDPMAKLVYPGSVSIPCGRCLGCRLDYSRQWADRMMLELDHSKKAVFLTLTYNEENVPYCAEDEFAGEVVWYDLYKPHVSEFMKVLRSRKEFEKRELRFFASGEYGKRTKRPHYHLIVFGLGLDDFPDLEVQTVNELNQPVFKSKYLEGVWKKGFCTICDVSWNTFAYVSRYVVKKAFNVSLPTPYNSPEFSLMSRRPGIGSYYFDEHQFDPEFKSVWVAGKEINTPKFYLKKLKLTNPELYDKLSAERSAAAHDAALKKLFNTDLSYLEVLENEENEKRRKLVKLERSVV